MGNLEQVYSIARDNLRKYCLIHDISGSKSSGAASFFSYRGRRFELHKALIQVRVMEDLTYEQVAERLRKEIVNAMRAGQVLCIDCGKVKANLGDDLHFRDILPWDQIFDFETFREQE